MTNDKLPKTFKEYIELSSQIDELEKKKSALKVSMLDYFDTFNTNELPYAQGTFYRKSRTSYEYSDGMKEMEKRVRQLKKKEEATGTAIIKSSIQYVAFVGRKYTK